MAGYDLYKEGAAMLPVLYPDPSQWRDVEKRLTKRAQTFTASTETSRQDVGFFLSGLAAAMRGEA